MPATVCRALAAAAIALIAWTAQRAEAQELIYGSWPPVGEFLNSTALPIAFRQIEAETKGAIKWKLIPGGQIADGKTTFSAVRDGLMQAGLGIPTYVPNLLPSNAMIYSAVIPGDGIGRDPDKFTDALWREVYSKLDPEKL